MFEDFDTTKTVDAALGQRLTISATFALGIFASLAMGLVALGRTLERLAPEPAVIVEFAEPPPAPEPVEEEPVEEEVQEELPVADARPLMQREVMEAPTEIPEAPLAESNADLAPITAAGPVDGFLTGVPGGRGSLATTARPRAEEEEEENDAPHVVEREDELVRARQLGGCRQPAMPAEARAQGIQDLNVVVRLAIGEDGRVEIRSISGNPVFHQAVRDCVADQEWAPAHLGDGTTVPDTTTKRWGFRLGNL